MAKTEVSFLQETSTQMLPDGPLRPPSRDNGAVLGPELCHYAPSERAPMIAHATSVPLKGAACGLLAATLFGMSAALARLPLGPETSAELEASRRLIGFVGVVASVAVSMEVGTWVGTQGPPSTTARGTPSP